MTIRCPRCERGNADVARSCLYCGAVLLPSRQAPAGRRTNPVHVFWVPSSRPRGDVPRLQRLLDLGGYEAGLLARSGVPRRLRSFGDAARAAQLEKRARDLGLQVFCLDEHTLETVPPVEAVTAVAAGPRGIRLRSAGGERPLGGPWRLAVTGRVPLLRRRVATRISMLPSEGGAGPGLPRVVRQSRTVSDHPGVLDLYPADADLALRVRERDVDYAALQRSPGPASALLHFRALLDGLGGTLVDDRFGRFDDLDPAHPGRSEVRPGVTVLDGIDRFSRYSRLLWHARVRFGWPAATKEETT